MSLKLRPYQENCLDAIEEHRQKGYNRQLVSMATGAGKTVVFSHLIGRLKVKSLVIAHTNELLGQARDKIRMISPGLSVGIVNGTSKQFDHHVVISSIQSARVPENLEILKRQGFGLCVYDEAHHATAESGRFVLDSLNFGNSTSNLLVGFSATPFRADGRGLAEIFDVVSYEKSAIDLIKEGYLCRPVGKRITMDLDLSLVETQGGDFQPLSLSGVMNTIQINNQIVQSYKEHGDNRKAICFCVTVEHAENVAEIFRGSGITAEMICGETPKEERRAVLNRYQEGTTQVLCNCQVLTEGFDAPETSCVIVARPTRSRGLFQQMAGRGLRLYPNKRDCLILDFGDTQHSICSTAQLLPDAEMVENISKESEKRKLDVLKKLPPNLNQDLKCALLDYDPLGDDFSWHRSDRGYYLNGAGKSRLSIVKTAQGLYDVIVSNTERSTKICGGLSFDYAFSSAERHAKENEAMFIVSDTRAAWRDDPVSERQKELIRARGYRAGIDQLTKGMASDLIASGVLKRAS